MPSPSRSAFLLVFLTGLLLSLALPAGAADTEGSDLIIITEGDVLTEDLYAAANRVIIRGRVEGDLIAVASQDVLIEGEVTGSVMAAASEVVVTGTIGGSLRATSPSVVVDGSIGNDVVAGVGSFELKPGGSIQGDVVVWAWSAMLFGSVGGDLRGSQRSLSLQGSVDGDVTVSVGELNITGPLFVGGDLNYRSGGEAEGLDQADVTGAVVRQAPVPANIRLRALGLVGQVIVAIALAAVALLVVWAWPERTEAAHESFLASPVRSYLWGTAIMFSPVLVLGLAGLILGLAPPSAALPLVAALVPLILALFGLVLVLALVAGVPVAAWVGSRLRKNTTIAGAVGLGSLVIAILWLIPLVGWIVPLLVLTGGLGAWIQSFGASAGDEGAATVDV